MYVTGMGGEMFDGHICMCKGGQNVLPASTQCVVHMKPNRKYQKQLFVISSLSISLENNIGKVTVTSDKTLWWSRLYCSGHH